MSLIDRASEQLDQLSPSHLDAIRGLLEGWRVMGQAGDVPISAVMAQTVVNDWLLAVLPDRFVAGEAKLIAGGDI
jgi:hypothetical protein